MKKILTIGHLPKYIGGKQTTGLANVIWRIANNINRLDTNYSVIIAATDVNDSEREIDQTKVVGWDIKSLLIYMLAHPLVSVYHFLKSIKLSIKYRFPILNTFAKLIFCHKEIESIKPDFIHLHGSLSTIYLEVLGINSYDIFLTLHGITGQDSNISSDLRLQKIEERLNLYPFLFVVFVNKYLIKQWKGFYGEPAWDYNVILNAYDDSEFYLERKNNVKVENITRLLTIGSISDLKGQVRVLKALSQLKDSSFEYICIGNGSKEKVETLKEIANKNRISFKYLGYCDPSEIRMLLNKSDYMILPSSSEGFGLVFLESIACGTPVILPKNLPLAKEKKIINSKNAIMLEDASVEAIEKVLRNIEEFSFRKSRVAKTINHLNWENIANQYISLLN